MEKFYQAAEEIRTQKDLAEFKAIYGMSEKKLILYGAGDCGHRIYNMLCNAGIAVYCFCDNKIGGCKDKVTRLEILRPENHILRKI